MRTSSITTSLALFLFLLVGCQEQLVGPEADGNLALTAPAPASAVIPGATHGGRPLTATLTGAAEVPGPGDPDGSGQALITLNRGQGEVCFLLSVEDIAPAFAAHIHRGEAGVPGPVVVGLAPPTDGTSSGCITDVEDALIDDIRRNPSAYYVNVHNPDFPAGAVRGQLSK